MQISCPALLELAHLESAAPLIRVAAHPIRLRIIEVLSHEPACVTEIASAAESPQPITSQHLATLRQAGILASERRGQRVYYRLERPELVKLLEWIRDHGQLAAEPG